MRLNNITQLEEFRKAIDASKGGVWLESSDGNKFNLKSILSQYIALGTLLSERGDELELFCQNADDEALFLAFFAANPNAL